MSELIRQVDEKWLGKRANTRVYIALRNPEGGGLHDIDLTPFDLVAHAFLSGARSMAGQFSWAQDFRLGECRNAKDTPGGDRCRLLADVVQR